MSMKNKVKNLLKNDFGSWTDYDYNTDYPCDGGCKDDYCRCG